MSEDINVEDIHDAEQIQESEELVDEAQVESNEEILDEAKAKTESEDEDGEAEVEVDGDEEEDDEVEESAPKMEMPKTKAGIVNAAYDMLKKAKKEDAQKIFAGMMKFAEGVEVEDSEVVAEAVQADVSHIDYSEDLDVMVAEEATLSEGFREKAGLIFEAALKSKVGAEVERLEGEYAQNLEEEVTSLKSDLVEKVDSYLSYVVEGWMEENKLAVETGLRAEIAEEFMASLQGVFKEHYIEVPEGKVDMFDELAEQVSELEEQLNKTTEDNIALHESVQAFARSEVVRSQSSDLASTEAEKLASLVEDLDFTDVESFEMKVKTIKESYFSKESVETVSEEVELIGSEHSHEATAPTDSMARYMQAIAKSNK